MNKPKGFRIFHILVSHKYEAEDLLRLLNSGKSFSSLAMKYSQCPSGKNGGELSNVNWRNLDEDFREAIENLSFEQISPLPVRTKFGYHLILKKLT